MKFDSSRLIPFAVLGFAGMLVTQNANADIEGYATLNGGTTGGAGGDVVYASTGTEINAAMCNRASEDTPLIIYVTGTINHANTTKVSGNCDTTGDEIQFKKVSNLSLIGLNDSALLDEIGIHLRDTSNIVLRNLHVRNVKKSGSPLSNGGDAIGMESNVFNVWVDHCELEASGGESDGYDSLIDMKATTQYVTVSYNYLHDSGRGGLIGSSDSDDTNTYVTFHHNYYQNIDSRAPLLRHGTAHAYNNYYNGINKSGMNPRIGGRIKAENNHFENTQNPIGTFYTDELGYWDISGNIFENVTWLPSDTSTPAGPNPYSTTAINIPYSYTLDDSNCVRDIALASAGAGRNLKESDGSCQTTQTSSSQISPSNSSTDTSPSSSTTQSTSSNSTPTTDGINLSIGADSDGSSKASGTSYGSVRDGDLGSYWAPSSASGRISIKWDTGTQLSAVTIVEASGFEGNIGAWELVNHDNGDVIAAGNNAGTIHFSPVTLNKIDFVINTATGTPTVAEFETYSATAIETSSASQVTSRSASAASSPITATSSSAPSTTNASSPAPTDCAQQCNWYGNVYPLCESTTPGWGWENSQSCIGSATCNEQWGDGGVVSDCHNDISSASESSASAITLRSSSTPSSSAAPPLSTRVFEEYDKGFCDVDGAIEDEHTGFTGSGYSNTDNAYGAGIDYEIRVVEAGDYTLEFSYANGASARGGDVIVNGSQIASLPFNTSGAWAQYSASAVTVYLTAGDNWLRLESTNNAGLPNLDSLSVKGHPVSAGDCLSGSPASASSASNPDVAGNGGACDALINDANTNWRDTSLQTDHDIIACLAGSLGKPIGYGEKTTGGFNPSGGSQLVIIRKNANASVEQQILEAISTDDYNWIVFDKQDFASPTSISMHRLECNTASVLSVLDATPAQCVNHESWCAAKGISSSRCMSTFYNERLNDSDLPIRNKMIMSNTTIDGRGSQAYFLFNGFAIGADSSGASTHQSRNVILTNLLFQGAGHVEDHELDPDMIRSTGESHDIWIHQNTFDTTGDSAFDVKVGAYDITVSFNRIKNVKRASLHGSSDSRTINAQITTTLHNNVFVTTDSDYSNLGNTLRRVPLIRRGQSHMFNNVFYGYRKDLLSVRVGGRVLFEDNMFLNNINNSEGDDLSYYTANLLRDFREGGLDISGSYVWMSDADCNPLGSAGDLTTAMGYTPNMTESYSDESRNTIAQQRMSAGDNLAKYVFATAGKGGESTYLAEASPSTLDIIANANGGCQ